MYAKEMSATTFLSFVIKYCHNFYFYTNFLQGKFYLFFLSIDVIIFTIIVTKPDGFEIYVNIESVCSKTTYVLHL